MKIKAESIIFVETDECLKSERLYVPQWLIVRNLRDIGSRRAWLDEMSLAFVQHGEAIWFRDGRMYQMPDLDEAFGNDADFRWLSVYHTCDGSNVFPRHVSYKVERLRLLNLFLKLRYPKVRSLLDSLALAACPAVPST